METNKDNTLSIELFLQLHQLIRQNVRFIAKWVISLTLLSVVYIFSIPRGYISKVVLLPETASVPNFSGSLGSLGSMMGLKSVGGGDAIYPEFYPKVLQSSTFLVDLLKEEVHLEKTNETVCLYDYFVKKQASPWWSGLFQLLKKSEKDNGIGSLNPIHPTKFQQNILDAMEKSVVCLVDKKNDAITISTKAQHPEVAQQMADIVKRKLQEFITDYRTNKARIDQDYYQKLYEQSYKDYEKAQHAYAKFVDANNDVVLESYRIRKEELENEIHLKYEIYSRVVSQLQSAMAKVQERTPAFTTVQPATIPLKPSSPKRMIIVVMMFILSFVSVVGWLLLRTKFELRKEA